jgi:hypothetical protein
MGTIIWWFKTRRVRKRIRRLVRTWYPAADVLVVDFEPRLCVWIITKGDADRDQIIEDREFSVSLLSQLRALGYECMPFGFQSQETVDREFNGNWYAAMN